MTNLSQLKDVSEIYKYVSIFIQLCRTKNVWPIYIVRHQLMFYLPNKTNKTDILSPFVILMNLLKIDII